MRAAVIVSPQIKKKRSLFMDCGEFVFHLWRHFLSGVWLMEIREREEGGIRRDKPETKRRKESTAAVTLLSSIVGGDVQRLELLMEPQISESFLYSCASVLRRQLAR